ncbi:MAG: ABC transporter permease [Candidatus Dormibacteria bacterium]|jgi:D-xylose transport system permease protein
MARIENDPPTPVPAEAAEPTGEAAVDLTAAAEAEAPPELIAQTLGQYLRGWWVRVRSGDSGIIPVVVGLVAVAAIFEITTPENAFLRPSNLVFIFEESTIYMVLAMAEIFILLLGEIDLSIGYVALFGGVVTWRLVQLPSPAFPWWAAIITALFFCGVVGALQGTLVARLKIPSFVVTLGGLLLFRGIVVIILGGADGLFAISTMVPNQAVIYNLVQGNIDPTVSWVAMVVVVAAVGGGMWLRAGSRRRSGLVAPPRSVTALRIALVAAVGIAVVAICAVNRGVAITIAGVPEVVPIVLVILALWTLLLQRTRYGRYVYAIGGNPEAARRAGVNVPAIRTWAFVLSAVTAGFAGILLGSFFYGQYSTNLADGSQLVLYAVAASVIGGTSLFGGRGKTIHGVLGGLVIGGIVYGMALLGLHVEWELIVTGSVLIAAVLIDVLSRRGASTGGAEHA